MIIYVDLLLWGQSNLKLSFSSEGPLFIKTVCLAFFAKISAFSLILVSKFSRHAKIIFAEISRKCENENFRFSPSCLLAVIDADLLVGVGF
jgi:hypothetical protein